MIRSTAIRRADAAGQALHGRGIAPDPVVHLTLDGVTCATAAVHWYMYTAPDEVARLPAPSSKIAPTASAVPSPDTATLAPY